MTDRNLAWMVMGAITFVFVGGFVVSVVDPGYQGYAAVGPAMGAVGGAVAGIALSRRNGNGNGKKGKA